MEAFCSRISQGASPKTREILLLSLSTWHCRGWLVPAVFLLRCSSCRFRCRCSWLLLLPPRPLQGCCYHRCSLFHRGHYGG